jgi:hypothetical protein
MEWDFYLLCDPEVEKSNFYKDLEGVLNYEIKEIDTKKK